MTEIVLHFGYPKTGTCALQEYLHLNRYHLREQGVYYPETGLQDGLCAHQHHALAFAVAENPYQVWTKVNTAELFNSLRREIDECGCETVLLSSEMFAALVEKIENSRNFDKLFKGNNVRAICFLRRQDDWLESCFKQKVWEGHEQIPDDIDIYLNRHLWAADYYSFLKQWADFLGANKVTPLVYEQAINSGGCIRRFCAELNIDVDVLNNVNIDERRNISPGALGTEILRMIRRHCEVDSITQAQISSKILEMESRLKVTAPRRLFSPEQQARIKSTLLKSNEKLANEFVQQPLDGFWFSARTA